MIQLNESQKQWVEAEVRRIAQIQSYTSLNTEEFADYLFDFIEKEKPKADDAPYLVKRLNAANSAVQSLQDEAIVNIEELKTLRSENAYLTDTLSSTIFKNQEKVIKLTDEFDKKMAELESENSTIKQELETLSTAIFELSSTEEIKEIVKNEEPKTKSVYDESGELLAESDLTINDIRAELTQLEVDLVGLSRATKPELYLLLQEKITLLNTVEDQESSPTEEPKKVENQQEIIES
jgi:predicted  nucleic acid-binding Zn-ribbon protein